jgi:putative addiction module component (TIGR02574 family)
MSAILKEIEEQALRLTPKERGELARRLIVSLDGEPEDSPEAIAKAWDEETARRAADMDAGRTRWTPADEVSTRRWPPPRLMRISLSDEAEADADSAIDLYVGEGAFVAAEYFCQHARSCVRAVARTSCHGQTHCARRPNAGTS